MGFIFSLVVGLLCAQSGRLILLLPQLLDDSAKLVERLKIMMEEKNGVDIFHKYYVSLLSLCLILFLFRVVAQLIQKFYELPFLPPFEAWYSGALAYHWLLASQILIIAVMSWTCAGFAGGRFLARRKLGVWLLALGGIYFTVMVFRLIAGFTFAADHHWLGAHIPAFFHIVLASFVLLVGHFHNKNADKNR